MAHALTVKQIDDMPIRKYEGIRAELRTGDIVFCSGKYFFSKAIQGFTKSVWSHVGIIYRDEPLGRVLILESETFIGVRLAPLSKYLKDYHGKNKSYKGRMIIARVHPEITQENAYKAISFGMDELTKPYDNWEIFRIALRILFKRGKHEQNREYICSELVQACFVQAGVKFPFKNTLISPDDIWKDERVSMQYRIH
jgi:Permuted papain-like amidase enzyme, YaeF/YiiX, C92 family